jgi:hypothetical protein
MELHNICGGKCNTNGAHTCRLGSIFYPCGGHFGWVQISLGTIFTKLFSAYKDTKLDMLPTDKTVASAIIRHGYIPSSPLTPLVCITIQCLELYRVAHLRCPHFSIQAFVKTICDLHSVSTQFRVDHAIPNAGDRFSFVAT